VLTEFFCVRELPTIHVLHRIFSCKFPRTSKVALRVYVARAPARTFLDLLRFSPPTIAAGNSRQTKLSTYNADDVCLIRFTNLRFGLSRSRKLQFEASNGERDVPMP
jgi:hypothetical protein